MASYLIYLMLLLSPVLARNVPRFNDLDEEDQHLFRAAYDAPSYDHEEYEEDEMPFGKLDLVKDGLWAIKAKLKELKAFDKAFAAHLLSTKLKVKDLLKNHLTPIKKHHHTEYVDKKPSYSYQAPSYQAPSYQYDTQYAPPQYEPQPQYPPPYAAPQYEPQPQYGGAQYAAPHAHDPYYGH